MAYRKSRYIDFGTGRVRRSAMKLVGFTKALPRSLEDKLELFECQVDVLYLGPAVAILKQIETHDDDDHSVWAHSSGALLTLVFAYFEMIGKSLNPCSKASGTAGIDFNYGFCDVYPHLAPDGGARTDAALPDVKELRDRIRNGMYHLGTTKRDVIVHNIPAPDDFRVSRGEGAGCLVLVNPHQVTRTIVTHFPTFMARLRNPGSTCDQIRTGFQQFFDKFHIPLAADEHRVGRSPHVERGPLASDER